MSTVATLYVRRSRSRLDLAQGFATIGLQMRGLIRIGSGSGPGERQEGSGAAGRASFAVLLVSQLAATAGFMFVIPFMPLYVQQLGVESAGAAAAWAGLLNTATALTMALAAPLWGRLADRVGPKAMLLRAAFAGAVVVGLMGLVTAPWQLLVLRLLQGTLTGTVAAATLLASATAPEGRASSRLGTLQMVIFVAAAAGPFWGGLFADLVGIRASFGVTGALLFLSGVMVLFGVGDARKTREEEQEKDGGGRLPLRALLPVLVALFVVHASITGVVPAVPGFLLSLTDEEAQLARRAGELLGAGALAAALGSVVGGRLAGRFGARPVILCALLLAGCAFLPQAGASSLAELWALRLASSFLLGAVIPVANLAVRSSVPESRQGAAFGASASVTSAAFGIGPLGGGLLAASFGFGAPFLAPGLMLLAAAVVVAALSVPSGARYVRLVKLVLGHLVTR